MCLQYSSIMPGSKAAVISHTGLDFETVSWSCLQRFTPYMWDQLNWHFARITELPVLRSSGFARHQMPLYTPQDIHKTSQSPLLILMTCTARLLLHAGAAGIDSSACALCL